MGKRLRHVAAAGKSLAGERLVPMAGGVGAAVQGAAGIVIFDLQMVAAGLVKIDRVGEVGALRFSDFAQAIFLFVGFEILPRCFDFVWLATRKP